ncbi:uncharacterized protein LOC130790091 [Actinidia eriantha]|uniref:uncharacterized protein LOC130790091 n=1 Tax=Actinidia eriantha TaxID=165200 RepID=UPI00258D0B0D|nr:uncharacterized protein LOC130790091 [Actinidia eriantha]
MSMFEEEQQHPNAAPQPTRRTVGGTEHSWCKAVPGGTGITVLALQLSKAPDLSILQNALHKLQISHPILRSKVHFTPTTHTFSYLTPPNPHLQIQPSDLTSTAEILRSLTDPNTPSLSPLHLILEHELNQNPWFFPDLTLDFEIDVFFATIYSLSNDRCALTLRLHTSACDRAAAAALLRELVAAVGEREERGRGVEREEGEVGLEIEKCIPSGKANKPFWARGADMLGYSLNSFRLANLNFVDDVSTRSSRFVRLQMGSEETDRILSGCKSRDIGLCGALAAAGLIAARSSKHLLDDQWEKYAVVTLIDCRPILDPVLSSHDVGFYHSAILNTHDIRGREKLWELAKRTYTAFANAKKNNKHFSDMADLNFLMCKAIDNPGLTPSSALRTSFISVFEDPVIDHSSELHDEIGLQDYIGCASVHGVGPSIAIFDTIRDGKLDCACVYPWPLHSREQMQELVDDMKRVLVDACSSVDSES